MTGSIGIFMGTEYKVYLPKKKESTMNKIWGYDRTEWICNQYDIMDSF